ncbi:sensor histidine kinase [Leifsonia xyli]|nr:histidine kinase [Leifsonia xyli]
MLMRDGSLAYIRLNANSVSVSPAINVSASGRPVWGWWFLDNGNLINGSDGSVIARDVDTYGEGFRTAENEMSLPLRYTAPGRNRSDPAVGSGRRRAPVSAELDSLALGESGDEGRDGMRTPNGSGHLRLEWTLFLVPTAVLTALDLLVAVPSWRAAVFLIVPAIGALLLWRRGDIGLAGLLSLALSATFVGAGFVSSFALGEALVLLVVLALGVKEATGVRRWLSVAVVALAALVLPFRVGGDVNLAVLMVAVVTFAAGLGVVLRNLDARRRLAVAAATQEQRDQLARELHDEITNQIAGIVLTTQAVRRDRPPGDGGLDADLEAIEAAGAEALRRMRRWASALRAHDIEQNRELGGHTLAEIPRLLERLTAASGVDTLRVHQTVDRPVAAGVQAAAYRIVQEGLTNVQRHAPQARWVEVSIEVSGSALGVRVVSPLDSGATAVPVAGASGLGLRGMTERAALLGGHVTAGPSPAGTWCVEALLPLKGAAR